jgi:hypothetical protein
MTMDQSYLRQLVDRQTESLSVEIKRWIDPSVPEGTAKIVKGAMALRNNNGGYLIIGFDNQTHLPDKTNIPRDVRQTYEIDTLQAIVSRYSVSPFAIEVSFVEKDGQEYPVISIDPGIKSPVVTRSNLKDQSGKMLIKENTIYVRTISSNNTPSTSEIRQQDWPRLLEICFDNREADIGRFIRRHLDNLTPDSLKVLSSTLLAVTSPPEQIAQLSLEKYVNECSDRFFARVKEDKLALPPHGAWEAAFNIIGEVSKFSANREFLNLIRSANPDYTGWPLWVDSQYFQDPSSQPRVIDGAWEALLFSLNQGWGNHLDFWRFKPEGLFYHRRAFEDDIPLSARNPEPLKLFDFGLAIWRAGEALAVGLAFAKAMNCPTDTTNLLYQFRWTGLLKRTLCSWTDPSRHIAGFKTAYQDRVTSSVVLPLETPLSSVPQFVHKGLEPLYEVFDGTQISLGVIDGMLTEMFQRKR